MGIRHIMTAYITLLIVLPVVLSLAAGQDPWAGYRNVAGMLVQAAEIWLEMRR